MIRIVEVGPRDGLQTEKSIIPTPDKVAFIDALSETGVDEIEVTSFVSPKWVPQLADAYQVLAQIKRRTDITYSVLVPNQRGLDRALPVRPDKIALFTAASNTFTQKNVNTSIEGTFKRFAPVLKRALAMGLQVRGYVSTAFWCPYEGKIEPQVVVEVTERLLDLGVSGVSLGDTIGKGNPEEVRQLLELLLPRVSVDSVAMHFHDTYGRAAANVLASYGMGIEQFDASVGGIGGCPYAPGASGNIATCVLVQTLLDAGAQVKVDLLALGRARDLIMAALGRTRSDSSGGT
ncbi:MAG: hydroxymethylglutaryl-CoA lyase [Myxococcota bacterium]